MAKIFGLRAGRNRRTVSGESRMPNHADDKLSALGGKLTANWISLKKEVVRSMRRWSAKNVPWTEGKECMECTKCRSRSRRG